MKKKNKKIKKMKIKIKQYVKIYKKKFNNNKKRHQKLKII